MGILMVNRKKEAIKTKQKNARTWKCTIHFGLEIPSACLIDTVYVTYNTNVSLQKM